MSSDVLFLFNLSMVIMTLFKFYDALYACLILLNDKQLLLLQWHFRTSFLRLQVVSTEEPRVDSKYIYIWKTLYIARYIYIWKTLYIA